VLLLIEVPPYTLLADGGLPRAHALRFTLLPILKGQRSNVGHIFSEISSTKGERCYG
jgi:hypothetical protein